jgi:hypothetical protein
VRNSGQDNWENTKDDFERAFNDVKESVKQTGEDVESFFEGNN